MNDKDYIILALVFYCIGAVLLFLSIAFEVYEMIYLYMLFMILSVISFIIGAIFK